MSLSSKVVCSINNVNKIIPKTLIINSINNRNYSQIHNKKTNNLLLKKWKVKTIESRYLNNSTNTNDNSNSNENGNKINKNFNNNITNGNSKLEIKNSTNKSKENEIDKNKINNNNNCSSENTKNNNIPKNKEKTDDKTQNLKNSSLKKKKNKKFTNNDDKKKYWYLLGLSGIIPIYYYSKRNNQMNNYDEETTARVKRIQKMYDKSMRQKVATYFYSLQNDFVHLIEEIDTSKQFNRHNWAQRHMNNSTGGGTTYIFENGEIFDKAVVQVNVDSGTMTPFQAIQMLSSNIDVQAITKSLDDTFTYYKTNLSSALYPKNPNVPTAFLDVIYNEVKNTSTGKTIWWFSGGSDLSTTIFYPEDKEEYFEKFKIELDKIDPKYYEQFRDECEEYTYMRHRDETRSNFGGIHFHELNNNPPNKLLNGVIDCCATQFIELLKPIIEKRKNIPWTVIEKEQQNIQNSRFVEFELISKLSSKINDFENNIEKSLSLLPLFAEWRFNTDNNNTN